MLRVCNLYWWNFDAYCCDIIPREEIISNIYFLVFSDNVDYRLGATRGTPVESIPWPMGHKMVIEMTDNDYRDVRRW